MPSDFLLYGSTGLVGDVIARLALEQGLHPLLAGRNKTKVQSQAAELGLGWRAFGLDDSAAIDSALRETAVVLNCAGPFINTAGPMVQGCLRMGVHYLDITGELGVLEAVSTRHAEATARGIMLLPAVGFDVVPSDCLALHLKRRLPTATRLTLAFCSRGPAGFPPGTINTMLENGIAAGRKVRRDGRLVPFPKRPGTRTFDFGQGPIETVLFPWADVLTAFHSTGIPNIEEYFALHPSQRRQMDVLVRMATLLRLALVRRLIRSQIPDTNTPEKRAVTRMSIWGEVEDDTGHKAASRLHGPEAGVVWTSRVALWAVRHVLGGTFKPGFQTPSTVFGLDFGNQCEGVWREDVT